MEKVSLIGSRKRKYLACLKTRIFAVSKRKPIFSERSAKGPTVRILLESESFERSQKFGRHQVDN